VSKRRAITPIVVVAVVVVVGCCRTQKQDAIDAPTIEARTAAAPAALAPPEVAAAPGDEVPRVALLPASLVNDWVAADPPRAYRAEDLHLLVDGGDEVFLRYGVLWAVRRTYRTARPTGKRVRIEVYAFASPEGAAGRYRHEALEAGPSWVEKPTPATLEGKVDSARLDMDQLRILRGRHLAILQYEDDAETDPAKLVASAELPLEAFAAAVAREIDSTGGAENAP